MALTWVDGPSPECKEFRELYGDVSLFSDLSPEIRVSSVYGMLVCVCLCAKGLRVVR